VKIVPKVPDVRPLNFVGRRRLSNNLTDRFATKYQTIIPNDNFLLFGTQRRTRPSPHLKTFGNTKNRN